MGVDSHNTQSVFLIYISSALLYERRRKLEHNIMGFLVLNCLFLSLNQMSLNFYVKPNISRLKNSSLFLWKFKGTQLKRILTVTSCEVPISHLTLISTAISEENASLAFHSSIL